ncbi:MAG: hypothetical protein M1816_004375 [Peltula sp. TS41687]|nr:MAG: hypothetical protein M1816_004375 [Peltula sp. TS41687]
MAGIRKFAEYSMLFRLLDANLRNLHAKNVHLESQMNRNTNEPKHKGARDTKALEDMTTNLEELSRKLDRVGRDIMTSKNDVKIAKKDIDTVRKKCADLKKHYTWLTGQSKRYTQYPRSSIPAILKHPLSQGLKRAAPTRI